MPRILMILVVAVGSACGDPSQPAAADPGVTTSPNPAEELATQMPAKPAPGSPSSPQDPGPLPTGAGTEGDGASPGGTTDGTVAEPPDVDAGDSTAADAGADGGPSEPPPERACPRLPPEAFEPTPAPDMPFDRSHEGLRALRAEAEDSLARFEALKVSEGDDYVYAQRFTSWVGFGCETEIEVRGGAIVRRTLTSLADRDAEPEVRVEEGADLGSHSGCHPLATLDDLYAECLDDVLCRDPADNFLSFETDEDGVLSHCFYVPRNCADDCSRGPAISSFEWL